jgi:hypothetical protein
MEHEYEVKLDGPGMQVAQKLSRDKALGVLAVLMGTTTPQGGFASGGSQIGREARPDDMSVTIGEFISELNVRNNAERLAAIALYLGDEGGQKLVPKDDFPRLFQQSGEVPPKNLTRDLQIAVARRLLGEDHSKAGYFFVTKTGRNLLRGSATPSAVKTQKRGAGDQTGQEPSGSSTDGSEAVPKKRARRNATTVGKGPTARILALKASGWLKAPRSLQEILEELSRRGGNYKRTDLTRLMITLVEREELVRSKKALVDGGRKVWYYSAA